MEEVDGGVDEVVEALQDVADALQASQAAQPGDQGLPPVNVSFSDHFHLIDQRSQRPIFWADICTKSE